MKKTVCTILILIFTGIFALGALQIYRQLREYDEGTSSYTDIEQHVSLPDPEDNQNGEQNEEQRETQSGEGLETNWPVVDFAALAEINPDIVAWIYIEDTEVNYPVVQGSDNQYYLKHLFSGEWNSLGCIFLDTRNAADFSDWNSIVYGHHMKNGTMFSGLTEYKKQEFYDTHPTILIMTPEQNFRVEIFAGYVANVKDNAWKVDFGTDAVFVDWQKSVKERSCFNSGITPAATDCIVTLSTCSYEFDNARFVLHGIIQQL